MTDERGHAAGSAGPRKSRRVGKGALLDSSRGQSRARAHSPAKTGVNALEDALWQNPGRQNLDVCSAAIGSVGHNLAVSRSIRIGRRLSVAICCLCWNDTTRMSP